MESTFSADQIHKIFAFLHDPKFLEFEAEQEAPTIFNAVGRTHTETWHSALLGWLLDPQGSHGLGIYPVQRLLLLLSRLSRQDELQHRLQPAELLAVGDLTKAHVLPNERELTEVSVGNVGRFDVYISKMWLTPQDEINLLIELKVEAPVDKNQCRKYLQHIREQEAKKEVTILPVFIAPEGHFIGSAEELFGDAEWLPIGFQMLYDEIIEPCLHCHTISQFGTYTLAEYVKTLKYRGKGRPLVVAQSDRDLVNTLVSQHRQAIYTLYEILSEQSQDFEVPLQQTSAKSNIKIKIGTWQTDQPSIAKLYRAVLEYLYDQGKLQSLELPIPSGTKRYLIAREPVHPFGNEFVNEAGYGGYYMEANKSRSAGLSDLAKLVQLCGLSMVEVK